MTDKTVRIQFDPIGRRIEMPAGATLLEAAQAAGVELASLCGGMGTCGECRVRLAAGALTPPNLTEQAELSAADLQAGMRLACQCQPLGDVRLDIPPESLTTPQRLQLEGNDLPVALAPAVIAVEISLKPPDIFDLQDDLSRVGKALALQGIAAPRFSIHVLKELSARLRAQGWQARLALRGGEAAAVLPAGAALFGLAVDVGTTKVAAYLVNLQSGATAAKAGAMNPQIAYGEDVISRIAYANEHPGGRTVLQARLVETLNTLLGDLCAESGVERGQVTDAVIVGNTAMHHLLAGLPVEQLGASPYVPAVGAAIEIPAAALGLEMAAGAAVYLPPNIAGYVGADHVSMLIGAAEECGLAQENRAAEGVVIALDIGTNTEISLLHAGKHWACSCASGPAFEGAHIHDGMRAAPGAVERVRFDGDEVQVQTIGGQPAVGICGSGILDAVAGLLESGLINTRGAFHRQHPRVQGSGARAAFTLVGAAESGSGRPVLVTRSDVNEIQLAMGAIRAGVEVLLAKAGLRAEAIERFVVAGAFGAYLDVKSAMSVGMFPPIPLERYRQVGNAAGAGARRMLLSTRQRALAEEIARRVEYVELTTHPAFREIFMKALAFPAV